MLKIKKIIVIPPDGILLKQDLSLLKMITYFSQIENIVLELVYIKDESPIDHFKMFDSIIQVNSKEQLIERLKESTYDLIIHRAWMHRYSFASELAEQFDKIIFFIKDWMDEISQKEYEVLFKTGEDYAAIKKIFESGNKIFSHFSDSYSKKLAKKYNIDKSKFVFFPEYCSKDNFYVRKLPTYTTEKNILFAGILVSTSKPEELSEAKDIFSVIKKLTEQKVNVHVLTLEKYYNQLFSEENRLLWADYLYEHYFNEYFSIQKGKVLERYIFNKYHFGMIGGLYYNKKNLSLKSICHVVPSKVSLYLEAGIPIIVNKKWEALASLVRDNNIGIIIENKDLNNINEKLNISEKEYNNLLKSVYKFREKFSYNEQTMKPILEMLQ